jgi:hypothetical protein
LVAKFCTKLGLANNQLLERFAAVFDPLLYEAVAQQYDLEGYPGTGKNSKWPTATQLKQRSLDEQFLYCARLEHFEDHAWQNEHPMKPRHHVGSVTNERTAQVYNWATSSFLVIDFSDAELNKICEMGSSLFDLDTIKKYAAQILDPQKRSASYLYAIARDASLKEAVSRTRRAEDDARQRGSLVRAIAYVATPRTIFDVTDDDRAALERTAEYMRLLQDNKDND